MQIGIRENMALVTALRDILVGRDRSFLLEPEADGLLRERGVEEGFLRRFRVLLSCQGVEELLRLPREFEQSDIDRAATLAIEQSGLERGLLLELMNILLRALGVPELLAKGSPIGQRLQQFRGTWVIPKNYWQEELDQCGDLIRRWKESGNADLELTARLRPLAEAGVPEALYLEGAILLDSPNGEKQQALELLDQAAQAGVGDAAGLLGDYYYRQKTRGAWAKAYHYYTDFWTPPVGSARRDALRTLENQCLYNRLQLLLCALWMAGFFLTVCLAPGSWLYPPHRAAGFLLFSVGAVLLAASLWRSRTDRVTPHTPLLLAELALWAAYMFRRIL